MLVDEITITIKAGNGGNGASTFLRTRRQPKGGPDGGDGGIGGSIFFQGTSDLTALNQFRYKKKIFAENGGNGLDQNKHGKNGKDTIVKVPIGTIISDKTHEHTYEIVDTETQILVAGGARGGRGNAYYKSATNQSPTHAEFGRETPEKEIFLELRFIAHVGLIGLPNAGKSSLLTELTNASPKIGDYPFTTLEPNLGIMKGFILADIPGLIEGASEGRGLGIKFLKHIERTTLLLHCIDCTNPDVLKTYEVVRSELEAYNTALLEKEEIILLTKIDMFEKEEVEKKMKKLKKTGKKVLPVSIIDDKSLQELQDYLIKVLKV